MTRFALQGVGASSSSSLCCRASGANTRIRPRLSCTLGRAAPNEVTRRDLVALCSLCRAADRPARGNLLKLSQTSSAGPPRTPNTICLRQAGGRRRLWWAQQNDSCSQTRAAAEGFPRHPCSLYRAADCPTVPLPCAMQSKSTDSSRLSKATYAGAANQCCSAPHAKNCCHDNSLVTIVCSAQLTVSPPAPSMTITHA